MPGIGLGIQEYHLACGWVHQPLLRQPHGPGAGDDVEEFQRLRPMRGVGRFGGLGQPVGKIDFRPLRLVHERCEVLGKAPGAVRGAGRAVLAGQGEDEPCQRGQSARRLHRRRQVEGTSQGKRCLIEGAEGGDARQQ